MRLKGFLIFYFETGSVKLSDIFSVAEWTNRVLLGFVYHVDIKLISYSDFTCATDDFQNSRKNAIFENCHQDNMSV